MTHRLRQRHPLSAIGANPLIASLRYRCECTANEVLQIQVVLDKDISEEQFIWTMRQMWGDVKFEVEQHLTPPGEPNKTADRAALNHAEALTRTPPFIAAEPPTQPDLRAGGVSVSVRTDKAPSPPRSPRARA